MVGCSSSFRPRSGLAGLAGLGSLSWGFGGLTLFLSSQRPCWPCRTWQPSRKFWPPLLQCAWEKFLCELRLHLSTLVKTWWKLGEKTWWKLDENFVEKLGENLVKKTSSKYTNYNFGGLLVVVGVNVGVSFDHSWKNDTKLRQPRSRRRNTTWWSSWMPSRPSCSRRCQWRRILPPLWSSVLAFTLSIMES